MQENFPIKGIVYFRNLSKPSKILCDSEGTHGMKDLQISQKIDRNLFKNSK